MAILEGILGACALVELEVAAKSPRSSSRNIRERPGWQLIQTLWVDSNILFQEQDR